MRKLFLILLLLLFGYVNNAYSKVWLLPDYQRKQVYSHRVNGPEIDNPIPEEPVVKFSCYNYSNWKPLKDIPEGYDCTDYFYGPETCCKSWSCNISAYPNTSASCVSAGKIADTSSGNCTEANGDVRYKKCKCDTSKYPHTSSNCSDFLYGNSCSDSSGTHYEQCIDACTKASAEEVCIASCSYGCNKTYTDCDTCCIECQTCRKTDCTAEGFTLSQCPANAVCEECVPGCDDNTKYFKATGCATNYYDPDIYWCSTYC
ncbi:MAG: hypothetical protein E7012_01760 [Alphaproteobacteria bacterium]|nr:hypothetical protein [Alphaproteobacteria bacterium]